MGIDKYGFFNQPTPPCIGQQYDARNNASTSPSSRDDGQPPFRPSGRQATFGPVLHMVGGGINTSRPRPPSPQRPPFRAPSARPPAPAPPRYIEQATPAACPNRQQQQQVCAFLPSSPSARGSAFGFNKLTLSQRFAGAQGLVRWHTIDWVHPNHRHTQCGEYAHSSGPAVPPRAVKALTQPWRPASAAPRHVGRPFEHIPAATTKCHLPTAHAPRPFRPASAPSGWKFAGISPAPPYVEQASHARVTKQVCGVCSSTYVSVSP